jgi:hypothetical protein
MSENMNSGGHDGRQEIADETPVVEQTEADLADVWDMLSAVDGRDVQSSHGPRFARSAEWLLRYKQKIIAASRTEAAGLRPSVEDVSADVLEAVRFAAIAHAGQWYEREVVPYIVHPLRLAMLAQSNEERIVAVLHDVVEDTAFDLATIEAQTFATPRIVDAVEALTRRKDSETYADYIQRLALNPLAARVKVLDLRDNMAHLPQGDSRRRRYEKALDVLLAERVSSAEHERDATPAVPALPVSSREEEEVTPEIDGAVLGVLEGYSAIRASFSPASRRRLAKEVLAASRRSGGTPRGETTEGRDERDTSPETLVAGPVQDSEAQAAFTDYHAEDAEWSDYRPRSVGRMREVLKNFLAARIWLLRSAKHDASPAPASPSPRHPSDAERNDMLGIEVMRRELLDAEPKATPDPAGAPPTPWPGASPNKRNVCPACNDDGVVNTHEGDTIGPCTVCGPSWDRAEAIARRFHEEYERLAPAFHYETRRESAKPWEQVPDTNRKLMTATVKVLLEDGSLFPAERSEAAPAPAVPAASQGGRSDA